MYEKNLRMGTSTKSESDVFFQHFLVFAREYIKIALTWIVFVCFKGVLFWFNLRTRPLDKAPGPY